MAEEEENQDKNQVKKIIAKPLGKSKGSRPIETFEKIKNKNENEEK